MGFCLSTCHPSDNTKFTGIHQAAKKQTNKILLGFSIPTHQQRLPSSYSAPHQGMLSLVPGACISKQMNTSPRLNHNYSKASLCWMTSGHLQRPSRQDWQNEVLCAALFTAWLVRPLKKNSTKHHVAL